MQSKELHNAADLSLSNKKIMNVSRSYVLLLRVPDSFGAASYVTPVLAFTIDMFASCLPFVVDICRRPRLNSSQLV